MGKHVIVGGGAVGSAAARLLAKQGEEVLVITRSGTRPDLPGVTRVATDASDPESLGRFTDGADALYNCANPRHYGHWENDWPPVWSSLLTVAQRTGAVLVNTGSLYPFGPVDVTMTEDLPDMLQQPNPKNGRIRAEMWAQARALHEDGKITAVEVRGSDYVGAGVGSSNSHVVRNVAPALRGKPVWVVGNPDLPHSWTDVDDMARTLVAVAGRAHAWGRVWLAPTNPPRTQREVLSDVLAAAGKPMVTMRGTPDLIMKLGGLVSADLKQLHAMGYMMNRSYVVDSAAVADQLGLHPTPWKDVCRRTAGLDIALPVTAADTSG